MKNKRNYLLFLLVIVATLGCDQGSKSMVRQQLQEKEWVDVLPPVLTMTYVENTGAFLGLGQDLPAFVHLMLMIVLPAFILMGVGIMVLREAQTSIGSGLAAGLLLGGGLGNIVDRIRFGSVTDFLFLDFGFAHTGIFNIADMCIMAGLFLYLFLTFRSSPQ